MRGDSAEIRCPFYRQHTRSTINCEGIVPDSLSLQSYFPFESKCRLHLDLHCKAIDGAGCAIYRVLMDKYI